MKFLIGAFLILALFSFQSSADDTTPAETSTEATSKINDRVLNLSKLTQEQIDSLRSKNYGWGEILHVGALVAKGQNYDTILADRDSGMGWGEIAKKYGFKLGELRRSIHAEINAAKKSAGDDAQARRELAQLEKEIKQTARQEAKPAKPSKPSKPERAGRPEKPGRSGK